MTDKPEILARTILAKTQIFCVEAVDLRFSNGEERTFERLVAGRQGAVMVAPVNQNGELLLIREYAAGTDRYELAFPKGLMEPGETPEEAANRELKEEVGVGARRITPLKSMTLAPGYLSHTMHLLLAEDLYPESLPGDEPEPMIVETWPIADWQRLLDREDFSESRSIAALFLVRHHLKMLRP